MQVSLNSIASVHALVSSLPHFVQLFDLGDILPQFFGHFVDRINDFELALDVQ